MESSTASSNANKRIREPSPDPDPDDPDDFKSMSDFLFQIVLNKLSISNVTEVELVGTSIWNNGISLHK